MTLQIQRTALLGMALAALTAVIGACSDGSGNSQPPNTYTTSSSATGGGGDPTGTGGGDTTGVGGGTGGAPPNCDGPEGCYDCPPKTTEQFLNACTDNQCSKFDNKARLPLFDDGKLPPVP